MSDDQNKQSLTGGPEVRSAPASALKVGKRRALTIFWIALMGASVLFLLHRKGGKIWARLTAPPIPVPSLTDADPQVVKAVEIARDADSRRRWLCRAAPG